MKNRTPDEKLFIITPEEKRVILIITAVIIVLSIALYFFNTKEFVCLLVEHDQEKLTAIANNIMESGGEDSDHSYYFCDIYYNDSINMVEFATSSWGIAPSGVEKGFYYSPQNIPLGYHYGDEVSFLPYEEGWLWEEPDGNNTIYTERIVDHWFWFEFRW